MHITKPPFDAASCFALPLLTRQGRYYYVPRYQRHYAWTASNLQDFVYDINAGLTLLATGSGAAKASALTFLGSAIFLDASGGEDAIYPATNRADAPRDVGIVIDGQQRITTLMMACVALATRIDALLGELGASAEANDDSLLQAVRRQAIFSRTELLKALGECRSGYAQTHFDYYPRVIRELDQWSTAETQARYASPVADLLHQSLKWMHQRNEARWATNEGGLFEFHTSNPSQVACEFESKFEELRRLLDQVSRGESEFQTPADSLFQAALLEQLLQCNEGEISDASLDPLRAVGTRRTRQNPIAQLIRLVLFARYLQFRVVITEVTAPDEENAFELFQALNTRGEPLTAYETFKPAVMERVPRQTPRYAELVAATDQIDNIVAAEGNSVRETVTQQILIAAAAYENGHKLGKNIREQRSWLKSARAVGGRNRTPSELIDFVQGIARVAVAFDTWGSWKERKHSIQLLLNRHVELLPSEFKEGRLAAEFLAHANHSTALPLLTPFVAAVVVSGEATEERQLAQGALSGVLCGIAATATLWRLAYGGTEGIDDALRSVMASGGAGFSRSTLVSPTAASCAAAPALEALRSLLERSGRGESGGRKDLTDFSTWSAMTEAHETYVKVGKYARLALAAAFDRATADHTVTWMLTDSRDPREAELSSSAEWWSSDYNIEHLVPQNRPGTVPAKVLHGLGNLALVPSWVNSSLSDKDWARKRKLFQLMAERSKSGAQVYLTQLREEGLLGSDSASLERVMKENIFHGVATATAALPDELSQQILEERGRMLLHRAHSRLMAWVTATA